MTAEELDGEVRAYLDTLNGDPLDHGNPVRLLEQLSDANTILARAAVLEAEAERVHSIQRALKTKTHSHETATVMRELVAGDSAYEAMIMRMAHELNQVLTSRIESLRTLVSWEKAQVPVRV